MKKLFKSQLFWVFSGIVIGVMLSFVYQEVFSREMAPVDTRYHDQEGILIASSESSNDRFLYKPSQDFPIAERFSLQMEHQDEGIINKNL